MELVLFSHRKVLRFMHCAERKYVPRDKEMHVLERKEKREKNRGGAKQIKLAGAPPNAVSEFYPITRPNKPNQQVRWSFRN